MGKNTDMPVPDAPFDEFDQGSIHEDEDFVVEVAESTLGRDMMKFIVSEMRELPAAWSKMNEQQQKNVIGKVESRVRKLIREVSRTIAAGDRKSIYGTLDQVVVKDGIKVIFSASQNDPARHDVYDSVKQTCLLVMPHMDRLFGEMDSIKADPDQPALAIDDDGDEDDLLQRAIQHVRHVNKASISDVQRVFKIGYNRAAHLIEAMEKDGIVSPMAADGTRNVMPIVDKPKKAPPKKAAAGKAATKPKATAKEAAKTELTEQEKAAAEPQGASFDEVVTFLRQRGNDFRKVYLSQRFQLSADAAESMLLRMLSDRIVEALPSEEGEEITYRPLQPGEQITDEKPADAPAAEAAPSLE